MKQVDVKVYGTHVQNLEWKLTAHSIHDYSFVNCTVFSGGYSGVIRIVAMLNWSASQPQCFVFGSKWLGKPFHEAKYIYVHKYMMQMLHSNISCAVSHSGSIALAFFLIFIISREIKPATFSMGSQNIISYDTEVLVKIQASKTKLYKYKIKTLTRGNEAGSTGKLCIYILDL